MKKISIIILSLAVTAFVFSSCADQLKTYPTDSTSEGELFKSIESAEFALNGVYRFMNTYETYTPAWGSENFGYPSMMICWDMVGEDMPKRDAGSAWFDYDYRLWVSAESGSSERPAGWWNFNYKIITVCNSVLASVPPLEGDQKLKNSLLGQAYAMRAFAYYHLINLYQLTYTEGTTNPGVPIYTEPTNKNTVGKGRGTVADVYTQINDDLQKAIDMLKDAAAVKNKSQLDLYVAYGLKARTALMQEDFDTAKEYAELALTKPGLAIMGTGDVLGGFNSLDNAEWMWGFYTIESQATKTYSFMSHMDPAEAGGYAKNSAHLVSRWLYDNIDDDDTRKQWFIGPKYDLDAMDQEFIDKYDPTEDPAKRTKQMALYYWEQEQNALYNRDNTQGFPYSANSYVQLKFRMKGPGVWTNDMLYMRASEMYLIIAEASIRKTATDYNAAVSALNSVVQPKLETYDANTFPKANVRTFDGYANDATFAARNLLDEVYFQRRLELWGEGHRHFDLRRLKMNLQRNYPETNHLRAPYGLSYADNKWEWVYIIPTGEINSNDALGPEDQNNEKF